MVHASFGTPGFPSATDCRMQVNGEVGSSCSLLVPVGELISGHPLSLRLVWLSQSTAVAIHLGGHSV